MIRLAPLLLYCGAGLCLFLILLNRFLILRPDSRAKSPLIVLAFLLVAGGAAQFGLTYPHRPWVFIPIAFLGLIALGEGRRAVIRWRTAGTPSVDATPCQIRLTRPVTTVDLVCRRYEISWPKWRGPGFRIAHLTDLHVNPRIPFDLYEQALRTVEQHRPDLVFITGDFISKRDSLPALGQLLRPLGARGTFAVLGNHDYWVDAEGVRAAVLASGITLLSNESVTLCLGEAPVRISGLDSPWDRSRQSVPAAQPGQLHLVLSHTPDNIYRISRCGADCVFSGHYHAGQIRVPLVGPVVVPSVYGRRFDHGHFVVGGTHLFVASGVGAANPPFRVYCQPDVFIVDVRQAA
jgi:predicted MPP superfamily phosphohydrolase